MPNPDRGFMIAEAVSAMNFEYHLRKLAEHRDRKKKQKNSPSAATERTKKEINSNKNDITKEEDCQGVRTDNPLTVSDGPPSGCSGGLWKGELRRE